MDTIGRDLIREMVTTSMSAVTVAPGTLQHWERLSEEKMSVFIKILSMVEFCYVLTRFLAYIYIIFWWLLHSWLFFKWWNQHSCPWLCLSQDTFGIWGSSIKGLLIWDESTILPLTRIWGLRFQHQNGESFGETLECNQIEFVRNIS